MFVIKESDTTFRERMDAEPVMHRLEKMQLLLDEAVKKHKQDEIEACQLIMMGIGFEMIRVGYTWEGLPEFMKKYVDLNGPNRVEIKQEIVRRPSS